MAGSVDYHTGMNQPAPDSGPLPPGAQPLVAAGVGACLLVIMGWFLANGGFTGRLVDHDAPPQSSIRFTVDINTADATELAQLPGIGPTTASRIVEHRLRHGPFERIESLLDVPGIGAATLDAVRPHLRPIREHAGTEPAAAPPDASP